MGGFAETSRGPFVFSQGMNSKTGGIPLTAEALIEHVKNNPYGTNQELRSQLHGRGYSFDKATINKLLHERFDFVVDGKNKRWVARR